jgi:hypothetical protein
MAEINGGAPVGITVLLLRITAFFADKMYLYV